MLAKSTDARPLNLLFPTAPVSELIDNTVPLIADLGSAGQSVQQQAGRIDGEFERGDARIAAFSRQLALDIGAQRLLAPATRHLGGQQAIRRKRPAEGDRVDAAFDLAGLAGELHRAVFHDQTIDDHHFA